METKVIIPPKMNKISSLKSLRLLQFFNEMFRIGVKLNFALDLLLLLLILASKKFGQQFFLVKRSLGISIGTGKPNYRRYGALFYQDFLHVQRKFPALHKHFKGGNFVCYLSEHKRSAMGFGQALESRTISRLRNY